MVIWVPAFGGTDSNYENGTWVLLNLPQNPSNPTITHGKVRAKPTDCLDLVNTLVNYAMAGHHIARQGVSDPYRAVGLALFQQVNAGFDFHRMEGSGFKRELYAGGQNSDLYRHIYGMAGGTVLGDRYVAFGLEIPGGQVSARTGTEFVQRQMAQDRLDAQGANGHSIAGGVAELADNFAGIAIGDLINSGIAGGIDQKSLRGKIYGILCAGPSKYPTIPKNTTRP